MQSASSVALLQEQRVRHQNLPFAPSFGLAFQIIVIARVAGAMYTAVTSDCDEVFNYWEPLHYLLYGKGFQTWEYSPAYAIRSWAYLLLHALPPRIGMLLGDQDKRPAFFALRLTFAVLSALIESRLYRAIVDHIGRRVGRYFLVFTFLSTVNLALSFYIAPDHQNKSRTSATVVCFAVAVLIGWPFAGALAVPFVLEELFVRGSSPTLNPIKRFTRLLVAGGVALLSILIPLLAIDSYYYNRWVLVPLNIVRYNVLQNKAHLYGTEPWHYYLINGVLNFNVALPLALLALPTLLVSALFDRTRLGSKAGPRQTSPVVILALRTLPLYLWIATLTPQPHKEERFLFPAYGFICFNAALTLYLIRGLLERFYINYTKSSSKASQSNIYATYTFSVLMLFGMLSAARIGALHVYYRAPEDLAHYFQYKELPKLVLAKRATGYPRRAGWPSMNLSDAIDVTGEVFDLEPLRPLELRMCWGNEWYRFPGSFLQPDLVESRIVRSNFTGLVPKPFEREYGTSIPPPGFNDDNREETSSYVPMDTCHYLVDTGDFDWHSGEVGLANNKRWKKAGCWRLLDNAHSPQLTRAIYLPVDRWVESNKFAALCLYKRVGFLDDEFKISPTTAGRQLLMPKLPPPTGNRSGTRPPGSQSV